MKYYYVIIFATISLIFACTTSQKAKRNKSNPPIIAVAQEQTPPNAPDIDTASTPILMIDMQKTGCSGKCPVFKIEIYSNGKIWYTGEKYADMRGKYESQLDNFTYKMLFERAKRINFFQLANQYPEIDTIIQELPNTITFVKLGSFEKRIMNNHDAPIELVAYEQFLQSLVDVLDWKKRK